MRIGQCINATTDDVENKKFDYWIGISLGNKYFSKENIQKYIEWSLLNTKSSILVLVADLIYAINVEVLDKRNKQASTRKALRLGDIKMLEVLQIIDSLPPQSAARIKVGKWSDIETNEIHQNRVKILFEEFGKKGEFYDRVMEVVKDNFKNHKNSKDFTIGDIEKLSEYVLHEMPAFLDGIHLFGNTYSAILYPGIGPIDLLGKDLQDGYIFPELTKKLDIKSPSAVIEAYVE